MSFVDGIRTANGPSVNVRSIDTAKSRFPEQPLQA
jgi:hypothetical protein